MKFNKSQGEHKLNKPKIIFVVGHKNWGKSRTLRALTNGNHWQRKITISRKDFFIRRMSNDDQLKGFYEFCKSISPNKMPLIIATLCPIFKSPDLQIPKILTSLKKKGYKLFFWVIKHNYKFPEITVTSYEITQLKQFGKVKVFSEHKNDSIRGQLFKRYVKSLVK
jgi:hypothetical protein